ncbi:hypothetical protein TanjilG_24785 [Lupinus angustifolius]|uniref:Uncharacterized protein n=2 Tax=Lupinus TaxID=3869 RepID=A0A4P1RKX5_LUPAN|nr:PREDICTED: cysteine-rich and transmembrane domain-containing protein A-like [Lupinus angustifolius]OIW12852.1 hypothetical protein TanjilG_24785 [Lupinus angustifolius]
MRSKIVLGYDLLLVKTFNKYDIVLSKIKTKTLPTPPNISQHLYTKMSYYNQQQPPVGVPPPQGYPQEYGKGAYPPPGYPPQGYPPPQYPAQGYPPPYAPQYAQPPPQQNQSNSGCMEGCLAALCCCCLLEACF